MLYNLQLKTHFQLGIRRGKVSRPFIAGNLGNLSRRSCFHCKKCSAKVGCFTSCSSGLRSMQFLVCFSFAFRKVDSKCSSSPNPQSQLVRYPNRETMGNNENQ